MMRGGKNMKTVKQVYFSKGILLENEGYKNEVICADGVLDNFTDTFEGAIQFVIKKYGVCALLSGVVTR